MYFSTRYKSENNDKIKSVVLSLDKDAYINDMGDLMYVRSNKIKALIQGSNATMIIYLRDEDGAPKNVNSLNLEDIETVYSL